MSEPISGGVSDSSKPAMSPLSSEPQPISPGGSPPQTTSQEFGGANRLKSLDSDIERELAEAMQGFSEKELFATGAAAEKSSRGPAGPEDKRKKGRVLAVRGPDVFMDVPGGRNKGVSPASQIPEGPPAGGSAGDFHS